MDPRPIAYIAEAAGGSLRPGSPQVRVSRISTDSRQVQPGDLFIALKGERFDGHQFLPDVFAKAPSAVLVQAGGCPPELAKVGTGERNKDTCAVIEVPDGTRAALARLATRYRKDFDLPVIAVAGSNGKTTTKEILHAVLRQKFPTLCSEASFNNDVGVPISLLRLESEHRIGIFEVGTNHPGELAPLLRMVAPRYSVITSIGREHMEHFGTLEGVAHEEGYAAELLPEDGRLFINGDTVWHGPIAARTKAAVTKIGTTHGNDWRVSRVRTEAWGTSFHLETVHADLAGTYELPLVGPHQPVNAAFAVAIGAELGLSRDQIQRGLAESRPPKMRLQVWQTQGVHVLDDAYNANTDSMIAALQTLRVFPCEGRRVAVLGDMAEQGTHSEAAHLEIGQMAAELGVSQLFTVGPMAALIAKGARQSGLHRVLEFVQVESAGPALRSFLRHGDVVLLKASRAMRLERITDLLRGVEVQKKN